MNGLTSEISLLIIATHLIIAIKLKDLENDSIMIILSIGNVLNLEQDFMCILLTFLIAGMISNTNIQSLQNGHITVEADIHKL